MALLPSRTGLWRISWISSGEWQDRRSEGECLGPTAEVLPLPLNYLISVAIEEFVCYRERVFLTKDGSVFN